MKKAIYKVVLSLLLIVTTAQSFAQNSEPEMADVMRSNGKIYVVVTVLSIVLAGIAIYLFALDRKISSIEKKINQK
jgi:protein-S-isoprenylcysteine O-methyltransferase Ste14